MMGAQASTVECHVLKGSKILVLSTQLSIFLNLVRGNGFEILDLPTLPILFLNVETHFLQLKFSKPYAKYYFMLQFTLFVFFVPSG